jgi:hypothetical protein
VAIVNDQLGRAFKEWVLFAIGCAVIVAMTAKWIYTGDAPDVTLGGIALILVGVGNEVLKRSNGG